MTRGEKLLTLFAALLLVALGFTIAQISGHKCPTIEEKVKVDTLYVYDTIKVAEPLYFKERVIDSIYVAVTDTIVKNDTTFVALPKQQRQYMHRTYHAWVSGYDPKLDSIVIYQNTKVVTKEIPVIRKEKSRWGVGITGGYGAGKDGLTPFVGVGVTYNILSW